MTICPSFKSTRSVLRSIITQFQPEIILEVSALEELDSYSVITCFLLWWIMKQKLYQGTVGGPKSCLLLGQCLTAPPSVMDSDSEEFYGKQKL